MFQCGKCKSQFTCLNEFLKHKRKQCSKQDQQQQPPHVIQPQNVQQELLQTTGLTAGDLVSDDVIAGTDHAAHAGGGVVVSVAHDVGAVAEADDVSGIAGGFVSLPQFTFKPQVWGTSRQLNADSWLICF